MAVEPLDRAAAHHHGAEHVGVGPQLQGHADAVAGALGRAHDGQVVVVVHGVLVDHVGVVGITAAGQDHALGVEPDRLVAGLGDDAAHGAPVVGHQGHGGRLEQHLDPLGEARVVEALGKAGAHALVGVPGLQRRPQGLHGVEDAALLLEPRDGLARSLEEVLGEFGVGHPVVVLHDLLKDLGRREVDPGLLLPVGAQAEHALGVGARAAHDPELLEHDAAQAELGRLQAGRQAAHAGAHDHHVDVAGLGGLGGGRAALGGQRALGCELRDAPDACERGACEHRSPYEPAARNALDAADCRCGVSCCHDGFQSSCGFPLDGAAGRRV